MASDYRVAVGHNIALVSLAVVSPQPTSQGLQFTRQINYGDGHVLNQGAYVEWNYGVVKDAAQYVAIMEYFDFEVLATESQNVTIYTRNELYTYRRYNGVAHRPATTWNNFRPRNVVIRITHLELLA
jgi:hypothetical protein